MRMTATIASVLAAARALVVRLGESLGSGESKLVRRAFPGASTDRADRDPTVFAVAHHAEAITNEDVERALADFP